MSHKFQSSDNALKNIMITNNKLLSEPIKGSHSGTATALNVDGNGRLSVDINSGVPTKTDGSTGHSPATGVGLIGFDGSTANAVHVDSNGVLKVQNVASLNVLPADALNSGTQNDPSNSLAVGLRGRTNILQSSTETFIKVNDTGTLILGQNTPTTSAESFSVNTGSADHFNIDLGNSSNFGILGFNSYTGGSVSYELWASHDNTTYYYLTNRSIFSIVKDGVNYFNVEEKDFPFRYARLRYSNTSGSTNVVNAVISIR